MPIWTLRLVACAGLVALLGRLPAVASVTEAFLLGLAGVGLLLAVVFGLPRVLAALRQRRISSVMAALIPGRAHPAPRSA